MECSCNIETCSDGDYCEMYSEKTHVARKEHKCYECRRIIHPGESYSYITGVWGGKFEIYKTCPDCVSVRDGFFHRGWIFGNIWDDLYEFVNESGGDIPESCIAKLTPVARERVLNIIHEYYTDDEDNE